MQLRQLEVTIKGLFLALAVAGLASCGGDDAGDNTVSCGGVGDSGVCLQVELIQPFHIDAQFTSDVDVNGPVDCDGDPATADPEPFTEHFADITFNAFYVDGNVVQASFVQVTNMIVTFTQNTIDPPVTCFPALATVAPCSPVAGPGPGITTLTTPINVVIPVGTSVTHTVPLMNFERKNLFTPAPAFDICGDIAAGTPGGPFDPTPASTTSLCSNGVIAAPDPAFLSYRVRYDFAGEDEFGQNVDAIGFTEVTIGAYNNC